MEEQNNQKSNPVLSLMTVIADIFWFFNVIGFWISAFILPILVAIKIIRPDIFKTGITGWREPFVSNVAYNTSLVVVVIYVFFTYFYIFFARKHILAKPHLKYVYMWALVALTSYLGTYCYKWQHKAVLDKIKISKIDVTLIDKNSGQVLPWSISSSGSTDIKGFNLMDRSVGGFGSNTVELLYGSIGSVKFEFGSTGYKSKEVIFEPGTRKQIKVPLDPNTTGAHSN